MFITTINILTLHFLSYDCTFVRTYAVQTAGVLPLWDLGLHLLRDSLGRRGDVEARIIMSILITLEDERYEDEEYLYV